jgi:hypothetical protein
MPHRWTAGRREFIQSIGFGAALLTTRGLFAETLTETARLTEGPFYPDRLPLDLDNDLLIINDAITLAVGEVTYLSGKVLTTTGEPIRNATVEIWQCDARGSYIHSRGRNPQSSTATSRASAVSRPARRVSTCSGRSSRCPTRCVASSAPHTSTWRSTATAGAF